MKQPWVRPALITILVVISLAVLAYFSIEYFFRFARVSHRSLMSVKPRSDIVLSPSGPMVITHCLSRAGDEVAFASHYFTDPSRPGRLLFVSDLRCRGISTSGRWSFWTRYNGGNYRYYIYENMETRIGLELEQGRLHDCFWTVGEDRLVLVFSCSRGGQQAEEYSVLLVDAPSFSIRRLYSSTTKKVVRVLSGRGGRFIYVSLRPRSQPYLQEVIRIALSNGLKTRVARVPGKIAVSLYGQGPGLSVLFGTAPGRADALAGSGDNPVRLFLAEDAAVNPKYIGTYNAPSCWTSPDGGHLFMVDSAGLLKEEERVSICLLSLPDGVEKYRKVVSCVGFGACWSPSSDKVAYQVLDKGRLFTEFLYTSTALSRPAALESYSLPWVLRFYDADRLVITGGDDFQMIYNLRDKTFRRLPIE